MVIGIKAHAENGVVGTQKQLLERIPLAGKDYEKFLFNVLVNEKDPNIIPYVSKKINTASLGMDEKKRWVHALAAIRDDSSTAMLRKILASSSYAVVADNGRSVFRKVKRHSEPFNYE